MPAQKRILARRQSARLKPAAAENPSTRATSRLPTFIRPDVPRIQRSDDINQLLLSFRSRASKSFWTVIALYLTSQMLAITEVCLLLRFMGIGAQNIFLSLANVLANNMPEAFVICGTPATLIFTKVGLFAEDTWKFTGNLTVTYGLRWEYNPAPTSASGVPSFTVNQVSSLATMTLAPESTSLWHAQR